MIPLSLETLPLAYVAICAGVIGLAWVAGALRSRRQARRTLTGVVRCAACGTAFNAPAADELPRCPCCGHPNERIPARYF